MTCTFRNATMDDIAIVLRNSTENGKVDEEIISYISIWSITYSIKRYIF